MAFATEPELEAFVGHAVDSTRATLLLDGATAAIVGELGGNRVLQDDYTATLDGTGSEQMTLPQWPVTAVASVVVDGDALTADDDYRWSQAGILERAGGCWPDKLRSVVVTWSAGYHTVPDGIRRVCLQVAGRGLLNPQSIVWTQGANLPVNLGLTEAEKDDVHAALNADPT